MKKLQYLGPDEMFSFAFDGDYHVFEIGKTYEVADNVAEQCLGLNPRGLDVKHANDYGAKVFKELSSVKGGGDQP